MIAIKPVPLLILLTISLLFQKQVQAQLTVNSSPTPAQLVQNVLLGSGVTATNITYTGNASARGSFSGTSNIGFSSGLIMATGNITNAIGPNNSGSESTDFGTSSNDPDLSAIASLDINDVAILEFDFIPNADTIKFRYVFGSEEYMEFANSSYNDAFGFFLSGPNPAGGTYNAQNIAIIPGTTTPVTINNVNALSPNAAYYFNNENPAGTTIEYDGFTVPLTAMAAVSCGQTYHIKIAIADVGDNSYDSGVFIEAGSFSSPGVSIIPQFSYGSQTDTVLYEGCGNACILFVRGGSLTMADTINLTISGTAVNGTDYYENAGGAGTLFPNQIIFAPGQDTVFYCITAVADGSAEAQETIVFTVLPHSVGACVQPSVSASISISEITPLSLVVSNDTVLNCVTGPVTLFANVTGGIQPYNYTWSNVSGSIPSQTVTPASSTNYLITVSDACSGSPDPTPNVTENINILVNIPSPMTVNAGADKTTCPGDALNLSTSVTGGASPFTYQWTSNTTDTVALPFAQTTSVVAITTTEYTITVTDNCGNTQADMVLVNVETNCRLNIPNVLSPDNKGPAVNELFYIENLERFAPAALIIYNRFGNKLFETDNYQNNWNGKKYSDGAYFYILTIPDYGSLEPKVKKSAQSDSYKETITDNTKIFTGFFHIVRTK